MQDGIIKATGNSRTIYASLPATYAEFKAAVEAGTQALDISYNAAGWQQAPTFLNKSNLLTDAVAALFGLTPNATPNDALNAAAGLISTAQTTANARSKIASGSYTGTGTSGSGNPNSLTFPFAPKLVIIMDSRASTPKMAIIIPGVLSYGFSTTGTGSTTADTTWGITASVHRMNTSVSGNTVSWYSNASANFQLNSSDTTYYWVAIG